MKYVGDQITECRRDTNNTDVSTTTGISTEDFLRYLNFAQENLQGLILQTNPSTFQSQQILSLVANQEAYSITDNIYLGERIVQVEFSYDGTVRNYYKLSEYPLTRRNTYPTASWPDGYIRRSGEILMVPTPAVGQGTLRVTYERQLDRLETRRGTITSRTIGSGAITALALDTATDDATALATAQYLCVNDKYGNVTMYNIPISAYDSGTGAVTIQGGTFTYGTGETAAVGDYVTVGRYTTTHSKLKDPCERYIQAYCNWVILGRDTASQSKAQYYVTQMEEIKAELVRSYQEADKDGGDINISNMELMLNRW